LKIFINGRFLSQQLTGVQRYAAEIVKAMDCLLDSGMCPDTLRDAEWQLLTPAETNATITLRYIKMRTIGRLSGHAWDQIELSRAALGGRLISLANSGPVIHPDHIVVIHDAQVFRRPEFFNRSYVIVHRTMDFLLARSATIATVSDFSRRELASVLHLSPSNIPVFSNGAEHFSDVIPDFTVIERLGLTSHNFFLSVGSMTKNKNISLAIEASRLLQRPDFPLVVVGGGNSKVFQDNSTVANSGIILAGRLTDEEIAALYTHALAFVFPSLYEGFGVPPLEAMLLGCPVIVSKADALRETCGGAAAYFDANDAEELSRRMLERVAAGKISGEERAAQLRRVSTYSWRKSAEQLLQFLAKK
jgi:glycosyltransferase involved in cell wall biosynthesis